MSNHGPCPRTTQLQAWARRIQAGDASAGDELVLRLWCAAARADGENAAELPRRAPLGADRGRVPERPAAAPVRWTSFPPNRHGVSMAWPRSRFAASCSIWLVATRGRRGWAPTTRVGRPPGGRARWAWRRWCMPGRGLCKMVCVPRGGGGAAGRGARGGRAGLLPRLVAVRGGGAVWGERADGAVRWVVLLRLSATEAAGRGGLRRKGGRRGFSCRVVRVAVALDSRSDQRGTTRRGDRTATGEEDASTRDGRPHIGGAVDAGPGRHAAGCGAALAHAPWSPQRLRERDQRRRPRGRNCGGAGRLPSRWLRPNGSPTWRRRFSARHIRGRCDRFSAWHSCMRRWVSSRRRCGCAGRWWRRWRGS